MRFKKAFFAIYSVPLTVQYLLTDKFICYQCYDWDFRKEHRYLFVFASYLVTMTSGILWPVSFPILLEYDEDLKKSFYEKISILKN